MWVICYHVDITSHTQLGADGCHTGLLLLLLFLFFCHVPLNTCKKKRPRDCLLMITNEVLDRCDLKRKKEIPNQDFRSKRTAVEGMLFLFRPIGNLVKIYTCAAAHSLCSSRGGIFSRDISIKRVGLINSLQTVKSMNGKSYAA